MIMFLSIAHFVLRLALIVTIWAFVCPDIVVNSINEMVYVLKAFKIFLNKLEMKV